MTEDERIQIKVRNLIEDHLEGQKRAEAHAWLDKLIMRHEVVKAQPGMLSARQKIAVLNSSQLEQLVKSGTLDKAEEPYITHYLHFLARIGDRMMLQPDLSTKVAFSDDELNKIWEETAPPGVDVGERPLLH